MDPDIRQSEYGVLPLIVGTLWTTAIGLLVAVPLGTRGGDVPFRVRSSQVRRVLKPVLEVLAGIPSVVLGFFALNFIAPTLLRGLLGIDVGTFSVLAAGLVLGVFIIPTIASISEDALSAVPDSLRQGSRPGCQ